MEKYFHGFLAFIDCTEQQIPKPVDKNRKKVFYSGKKKRHTVKNQLIVNSRGYIFHKIGYKKGRKHDYDVYKKNHPTVIPKQVVNVVDLGYLGIETDFPEQLSALPFKKQRNGFLSDEEKEYNKIHSKKRMIIVEHTISRLKKYKIMRGIFRNKLRKYNKVSDIVTGLINYRISNQQN